MTQSIYLVKAIKGHDYASEQDSIILTTFDRDKAISFAKEYCEKNQAVATTADGYDFFGVNVYEQIIEQAFSETIIFSTYFTIDPLRDYNSSFYPCFLTNILEREAKFFYTRKGSTIPSEVNPTLANVFYNTNPAIVSSEALKDNYLSYFLKDLEAKISLEAGLSEPVEEMPVSVLEEDEEHEFLFNQFELPHYRR